MLPDDGDMTRESSVKCLTIMLVFNKKSLNYQVKWITVHVQVKQGPPK